MALEGKQFSHYHILKLIGRGSMGEVYLIEDVQIQRRIAAKVIRMDTVQSEQDAVGDTLRLFWREATAIARLDHPHILPLYDHGETIIDGSPVAYLTMPYRPEGSLITWLRQRARNSQTRQLTMQQVAHIILQAGQALQYAHDHQVMHLDVKPANFLIRSRSQADEYPDLLLSDFGIARLVNAASNSSQQVRGTPIYMSPEQWASRPVFASDQYALAIMAYELITGQAPFYGSPLGVMFSHIHQQPQPAHTLNLLLPPAVDPILQRALAKEPAERFPSVAEFAQAFYNAFPALPGERALRVLRLLPASDAPTEESTQKTLDRGEQDDGTAPAPTLKRGLLTTIAPASNPPFAETFPPISTPYSDPVLPQTTAPLPALSATTITLPGPSQTPQPATLPPLTVSRPARPRKLIIAMTLILLLLLLLGTGSLSLYHATTGNWPWKTPALTASKSPRVHDTLKASTSTPGQNWHLQPGSPSNLNGIARFDSLFIALGDHGTIFTSPNGTSWTRQHAVTSHLLEGITWSGSLYVIVGDNGTILTSPDGTTWTSRSSGTTRNLYDVVSAGSRFIAVGDNGLILTSPNGTSWQLQTENTFPPLYGIYWARSHFVVVNDSGILTSPNGTSLTQQQFDSQTFDGITWSNSRFVAVGYGGTILTSPDGTTWTPRNSGTTQDLYDIDWSGSLFVTVGQNGTILTSPDGTTWTPRNSSTTQDITSVACSGTLFVAVESNGILTSA